MVAPVEPTSRQAGLASLEVQMVFGESTVTSSFATSPMKLLAPRSRGRSVWAYISSFGGGMVAGDQTKLDVQLRPGTRCFLGTQASTKIYRNPASLPSGHETRATLEAGSLLVFAPDPVQAFAGSMYSQRQRFDLAPDASLVLLDWFTSGRAARGERWECSRFASRNEVWREKSKARESHPALQAGPMSLSSPLAPALSPLRGEGAATDTRPHSETKRRDPASRSAEHCSASEAGIHAASTHESTTATNAANGNSFAKADYRAPSPLNEERAGVRGEAVRSAHAPSCDPTGSSEVIYLDSLLLSPDDGELGANHRLGRFNCIATILLLGPALHSITTRLLEAIKSEPVTRRSDLVFSASPLADGAVLRIAGVSVEAVGRLIHHHLQPVSEQLGDDPWARKW